MEIISISDKTNKDIVLNIFYESNILCKTASYIYKTKNKLNRFGNEMPQKLPNIFAKNNDLHLHVLVADVLKEIKC